MAKEKLSTAETLRDDILKGYDDISRYLGWSTRQVRERSATGALPTFRVGRTVCANRSVLDARLIRQQAAGRAKPVLPAPAAVTAALVTLSGHDEIAAHLRMPAGDVVRMDAERRLPTYLSAGRIVASSVALDHWMQVEGDR